jgi:RNA polymerase sigma-70 factor (ECF subfamily)
MYANRLPAEAPDADFGLDFARALTVLKEEERTAMLLFYMEDRPVAQIAAIMRTPAGTVKSHLHRGREKLAVWIKNDTR